MKIRLPTLGTFRVARWCRWVQELQSKTSRRDDPGGCGNQGQFPQGKLDELPWILGWFSGIPSVYHIFGATAVSPTHIFDYFCCSRKCRPLLVDSMTEAHYMIFWIWGDGSTMVNHLLWPYDSHIKFPSLGHHPSTSDLRLLLDSEGSDMWLPSIRCDSCAADEQADGLLGCWSWWFMMVHDGSWWFMMVHDG